MQYEWKVHQREHNLSLLSFVQLKLEDKNLSLRKIKGWIDAGFCFVGGRQERFSKSIVSSGQKVSLKVPEAVKKEEITYLFEDEAILIINKPAGITCDERLVDELKKKGKHVVLVHRLDKETSGVLLLAKSAKVKDYFIAEFKKHAVQKIYVAICDGTVKEDSGIIKNYLGPIERYQGHVKWGVVAKDGHFAETEWNVRKRGKDASLLQLMPITGRTHQLRIHTSGMSHPILGDHSYARGFRSKYRAARTLLHAAHLSFSHPLTGAKVEISCPLPEDFEACLKELF